MRHRIVALVSFVLDPRRASSRKISCTLYRFDSQSGVWIVANRLSLGNTPLDSKDLGLGSTAFHLESTFMSSQKVLHADVRS